MFFFRWFPFGSLYFLVPLLAYVSIQRRLTGWLLWIISSNLVKILIFMIKMYDKMIISDGFHLVPSVFGSIILFNTSNHSRVFLSINKLASSKNHIKSVS